MLQRLSPWLAAGTATGIVVIAGVLLAAGIYLNAFTAGYRSTIDQKLVTAVIETSATNPQVQAALKNQINAYLNSPEGKAKIVELIKSPEMTKALSDNIQSPEMRSAIIKLLEVPEFRGAVLQIIKDTPEMRVLNELSSAIILEPDQAPVKSPPKQ